MKQTRGYTLVELMVVMAVLGLLVAYLMETVSDQKKTYTVIDQVTEAQQNLRLVTDMIERGTRRAGYLVPPSAAACAADSSTGPDALYLSATDRIRSIADLESIDPNLIKGGLGAAVTGIGTGPVGTGSRAFTLSQLFIDVQADGKDFVQGEGIIFVDRNDLNGVVACGQITSLPSGAPLAGPANITVQLEANSMTVTPGADIVAVPAHMYRIVPAAGGTPSQLFRDNDLMASDVEDLQAVFYFDDDDDRVVDPGEMFGDAGGAAYPPPASVDYKLLLEIQLNLVTVTRSDDPNQGFTPMKGQPTANRTIGSVPGPDLRRRRVHSSSIRLRNLG